jgi:hypothetical protein
MSEWHTKMHQYCKNCRFYARSECHKHGKTSRAETLQKTRQLSMGNSEYYTETVYQLGFPWMGPDDWCGEWEPDFMAPNGDLL